MVAERNKFRAINGYNKIKYSLSHFVGEPTTPCVACNGRYFTAHVKIISSFAYAQTSLHYGRSIYILFVQYCASLRIRIMRDCKINSRENWFWCRNHSPATITIDVFVAGLNDKGPFELCGSSCASDDHFSCAHSDCVYQIALRS